MSNELDPDQESAFWVQPVCKDYQQTKAVATSKESIKILEKKESLYLTKLTSSISVIKKMPIKLLACSFSSLENNHFLSTSNKCQIIFQCSKFVVLPSLG